jgi:glycosyltransferase involved in cell wall biosynthesis
VLTKSPVIVHVVERLAPGGIETLVHDLVAGSKTSDHIVSLWGTRAQVIEGWPLMAFHAGNLHGMSKRPGIQLSLIPRLAQLLRRIGATHVFAHHMGPLLYAGAASRLAGLNLIFVEHDCWHYDARVSDERIIKFSARFFRPRIVAVNDEIASRLRKMTRRLDVSAFAPGVSTSKFVPSSKQLARYSLGLNAASKIIGTAGRLVEVKGHAYLIEALTRLDKDTELAIVGDGPDKQSLMDLSKHLGISERVHFLGHRDDLSLIYPAFDVFCLPSLAEGLPRAVLEAQACGIPVVASDVGSVITAIAPDSGGIVPPRDAAMLAEAIERSLKQKISPQTLHDFIDHNFSLSQTQRQFEELARLS